MRFKYIPKIIRADTHPFFTVGQPLLRAFDRYGNPARSQNPTSQPTARSYRVARSGIQEVLDAGRSMIKMGKVDVVVFTGRSESAGESGGHPLIRYFDAM